MPSNDDEILAKYGAPLAGTGDDEILAKYGAKPETGILHELDKRWTGPRTLSDAVTYFVNGDPNSKAVEPTSGAEILAAPAMLGSIPKVAGIAQSIGKALAAGAGIGAGTHGVGAIARRIFGEGH